MDIKPIPAELLCDSITLIKPSEGGEIRRELRSVRVVASQGSERRTDRARHICSVIGVYYDCVQSEPNDAEFSCGEWIEWQGKRYEITKVQELGLFCRHHFRITAECRLI